MLVEEPEEFDLEEEPAPRSPRLKIILWLVVLGLGLVFVSLYFFYATVQSDVFRLEGELAPLEQTIATEQTPPAVILNLMDQSADLKSQLNELNGVYPTLAAGHYDWQGVMGAVANYDESRLILTELTQLDDQLTISGRALDDLEVAAYSRSLENSGQFASVEIQSINQLEESFYTPTISPTVTPEPTETPAPTETPPPPPPVPGAGSGAGSSGGSAGGSGSGSGSGAGAGPGTGGTIDQYEPNDFQPSPIFVGELQTHNFFPQNDVDNVVFLAKANRQYKIETQFLMPGVDTVLEARFNGSVLFSDDFEPGTLASRIVFQAGSQDVDVLVRISNLGAFGGGMSYQISVEELLPTPTVTPGGPPPGGPTATPAPQPTSTPTPTPTPVLGDQYEPDDVTPGFIGVGQVETHTFDPSGDIDKTVFRAKAGRFYQVFTDWLALGVDTALTVKAGSETWENDDYAQPGSGNFASGVCFTPAVNTDAEITVRNINYLSGPSQKYDLAVEEVVGLVPNKTSLAFGPVVAGGANPPAQRVTLTATQPITWSWKTAQSWIQVTTITTTNPSQLDVGVATTGLAAGTYQGAVTLRWEDFCQETITVTLQIDPASTDSGRTVVAMATADDKDGSPTGARVGTRPIGRAKFAAQNQVGFVITVELIPDLSRQP